MTKLFEFELCKFELFASVICKKSNKIKFEVFSCWLFHVNCMYFQTASFLF